MEGEGLVERPAVLKGMKPTRCHVDRLRQLLRRTDSHPRIVCPGIESGNDGISHRPGLLVPPDKAGPSRAKHPFVCPRNQEIASDVGEAEIFDAQRMDPIYAEDHSILLRAG